MRMRHGFTLIEVLVAITVLAVIVAVAAPMVSDDSKLRLRAGASILISDLEYAQVSSIAFPRDLISVRFDPAESTYWLAYQDSPETPLTRPDTGRPYLVKLGQGRAGSATGVTLAVEGMTANTITFNAQGGLTRFDMTPVITLASTQPAGSQVLKIEITPITGNISEYFTAAE